MHQPGDIIHLDGTGDFEKGIECEVLEVDPEDGRILKMKAVHPDARLGRMGFILEGDDWIAVEWEVFRN